MRGSLSFGEFLLDEDELGGELFHFAFEFVHSAGGGVEFAAQVVEVAFGGVAAGVFSGGDLGEKVLVDGLVGGDVFAKILAGDKAVHEFHGQRIGRDFDGGFFDQGKDGDDRANGAEEKCADDAGGIEG